MIRVNNLGGINQFLWIYPLMFLYGVLGFFLHLNNDVILRLLFYFPSLIFGFTGVYFLTKYLKFSMLVTFFATLVYLVNSYYLLVIDGGQVGVVLAYGAFPLVLFLLIKLIEDICPKNFLFALLAGFFLTVVDFRIFAICIFTAAIWELNNLKKIWILVVLALCLTGLSAYWIIPILKTVTGGLDSSTAGLQTTSLLNSLLLSAPNWPANQFGKTIAPFFYFSIVPVLVFLPLFFSKQKKIIWLVFIFLVFAFLAKGTSAPFGAPYTLLVNTELGSVFRDSTKFFMPLILVGGILIGLTVEKVKSKYFSVAVFFSLLFLVWQAFFGSLNGVLGKVPNILPYQNVYKLISGNNSFLRSLWFYEKSPFAYQTDDKQALDAKGLSDFRPFAAMNNGTSDRVNFINNSQYLDWFKLLGIKYLIFNGNPREVKFTDDEQKDWDRLINLVSNDKRLQKVDVGTGFPVYINTDILPNKFYVNKAYVVLGGDDIYKKLLSLNKNFSLSNQGFLFPEDGKFDFASLKNVSPTSAVLIFNNKSEVDLEMSFLQTNFTSPKDASQSEWSTFSSNDYLEYKYQLLIRNVVVNDFDFGKGVAFSTKVGEKITFKLNVPKDGTYVLAIRKMDDKNQNMKWFFEDKNLKKGDFEYTYVNKSGFEILNTVGLISTSDMENAKQSSQNLLEKYAHYDVQNKDDQEKISEMAGNDKWLPMSQSQDKGWIIFTDSYNVNWEGSYPMYSMINGFYISTNPKDFKISFKADKYINLGIYLSVFSFVVIVIGFAWKYFNNKL